MAKLYIVRHGNTFDTGDTILRVGGRTDLDLSLSGHEQAVALGANFKSIGVRPASVLAGPLKRTRQTAEAITSAIGLDAAIIDERLREVDYGPDEGQPEETVVARIGEAALAAWEAEAKVPEGWLVDPAELAQIWQDIMAETEATGSDLMAVTSNGVARFALSGDAGGEAQSLKLKTGAYGIIEVSGGARRVLDWNVRP